ncbi:MAG: hypothetical protein H0Z55_04560 [Nitrosarchaeum sp.]|nr:hypothetical protein [Nitrosarchaeum sp.]
MKTKASSFSVLFAIVARLAAATGEKMEVMIVYAKSEHVNPDIMATQNGVV